MGHCLVLFRRQRLSGPAMATAVRIVEMGSSGHRRNHPSHSCIWKFLAMEQACGSLILQRTSDRGPLRKEESMLNRRLTTALRSFAFLTAALLVAGIVCEQIGRRQDRARLPQIGT